MLIIHYLDTLYITLYITELNLKLFTGYNISELTYNFISTNALFDRSISSVMFQLYSFKRTLTVWLL